MFAFGGSWSGISQIQLGIEAVERARAVLLFAVIAIEPTSVFSFGARRNIFVLLTHGARLLILISSPILSKQAVVLLEHRVLVWLQTCIFVLQVLARLVLVRRLAVGHQKLAQFKQGRRPVGILRALLDVLIAT